MADREKLIELLDGVLTTEDVTASEKVADHAERLADSNRK